MTTQSLFDRGYTRVTSLSDLTESTARVFRAGGSLLLLIREGAEVLAFDGSCVAQDRTIRGGDLVRAIVECFDPNTYPATLIDLPRLRRETEDFHDWPRFPATIEASEVWVDVNGPAVRRSSG